MSATRLVEVLRHLFPELCIWDYREDFDRLWSLKGIAGHQVVVWTRTPQDPSIMPVATEGYLTPYDWSIAACARDSTLRVTVVDLRREERGGQVFHAVRWLSTQRKECVPWLRSVSARDLVEAADLEGLRALFMEVATPSRYLVTPAEAIRALPICHVDLSGEAGHHAISNLVGPLLLLRGSPSRIGPKSASVDHRAALRRILESAGFLSLHEKRDGEGSAGVDVLNRVSLNGLAGAKVVLVDDQWHHGWAQWVCERLGLVWDDERASAVAGNRDGGPHCIAQCAETGNSLWVAGEPEWLIDRLKACAGDNASDVRLGLDLAGSGGAGDGKDSRGQAEILLLDLRLFRHGDPKERTFAKVTVSLARRFVERGAWPTFGAKELDEIEAWSAGDGASPQSAVLTLLARLLAHVDPTLPIVLFSSTRRRDIVEKLTGYGSISTQFSKPLVVGDVEHDLQARAEESFAEAMTSARRLALARSLCRRVVAAADGYRELPPRKRMPQDLSHFELYLDESGSAGKQGDIGTEANSGRDFVIAGLLVAYRGVGDSAAVSPSPSVVHDAMGKKGLRWWPETAGDRHLAKRATVGKGDGLGAHGRQPGAIFKEFKDCLGQARAIGVCLKNRDARVLEAGDSIREHGRSDNRYRHILATLIELVLFDLLPEIKTANKSTISVFVATRVRTSEEFVGGGRSVERLCELYGYASGTDSRSGDPYFRSLDEAAVLPVIMEILERRDNRLLQAKVEHARGVTLRYGSRPRWNGTRHQHYLADLVANQCFLNQHEEIPEPIKELLDAGAYDVLDARLGSLVWAVRALEAGDRAGAVCELLNTDFSEKFQSSSISVTLLRRISREILTEFRGADFVQLAQRMELDAEAGETGAESRVENGIIVAQDGGDWVVSPLEGGADARFYRRAWRSATLPSIDEPVRFLRERHDIGGTTTSSRAIWVESAI